MNTYTIQQALTEIGRPIPRIEARLDEVYERKTGEGQYGPYSFQNGEISDATGKMKVVFANCENMERLRGNTVVFKSMQTAKHGLKGVEVKEGKEYKGKIPIELKVSKAALVVTSQEEGSVQMAAPANIAMNTAMTATEARKLAPQANVEPMKANPEDRKLGLALAKNRMTQLAGLYDLCWKTVLSMDFKKDLEEQGDISDMGMLKDVATTLFIQATREGLADKMVVRTTSKFYNEDAIKPEDPKNPGCPLEEDEIPF